VARIVSGEKSPLLLFEDGGSFFYGAVDTVDGSANTEIAWQARSVKSGESSPLFFCYRVPLDLGWIVSWVAPGILAGAAAVDTGRRACATYGWVIVMVQVSVVVSAPRDCAAIWATDSSASCLVRPLMAANGTV
jgi:hypothetical protein